MKKLTHHLNHFSLCTFLLFYFTEPEPPTKPITCDYGQYCALVDCTKTGAADLCPDQCSK